MQDWSDRVFQQYTARLVALARSRMQNSLQSRFDPEDVVMSAWRSFFCGMQGERFREGGSEPLWPLLATLTLRKLSKSRRLHNAAKRSANDTVEHSDQWDCESVAGQDPDAEDLAIAAELKQTLLIEFEPRDQLIIEMSIEGYLQSEIAKRLCVSDRTVRRVLVAARTRLASIAEVEVDPKPISESRPLPVNPALQRISYADVLLKSLIGSGSFGKVYKAEWNTSGKRVAIKFLRKRFWQHPSARFQFLQDVDFVARIIHPNVIKYYGWGESPQGGPFIAMEFISGMTLGQWLSSHWSTVKDKLEILRDIASALAAVHSGGVLHGDLSPVNILVTQDGRAVLTDFGFAHSLSLRESRSAIGGTLGFAAPEQLNSAFGNPGPASDCYAWGALAWYLLVGSPVIPPKEPFAMVFDTLSARSHDLSALCEIQLPNGLVSCVGACLDKGSQRRPSAAEIVEVLKKHADV